jgi:hypothetical protein
LTDPTLNPLQICDGLWAQCSDSLALGKYRGIFYEELLPPTGHGKVWNYHLPDVGITYADVSFLASYDLQVFVEKPGSTQDSQILHFRTMSTNEPHPLAALAFFETAIPRIHKILLYENHIAVIGNGPENTLLASVWDWTLGRLEMVRLWSESLISSIN